MKKLLGLFGILLLLIPQDIRAQDKITGLFQVISDSTSTASEITMAYIDLSWEYMYVSSDSAELFGKMAFQQVREHHLIELKPEAYNVIGVNKIVLSEFDTAIIILQKGMVSCNDILSNLGEKNEKQEKKIQQRKIGIFANIGNCYYHKSEYEQALSYYLQSAKLAHQLDEKWRESVVLTSMGSCYHELKKYKLSLEYHEKSLELALESKDSASIAGSYLNIGAAYMYMDNFEQSKEFTLKAAQIFDLQSSGYFLKIAYLNLSNDYLKTNNLDSAYIFLNKGFSLIQEYPEQESEMYYHYLYGDYLHLVGNVDESIIHFTKCYLMAKESNWDKYKNDASIELVYIYEELKIYDSAFKYLVINRAVSDSLFTEESDKRIAEMEVKYQVEKQELNIKNLKEQKIKDEQLRLLLFILLIVIIVSSAIIIASYILRRKRTKQLYETERKLLAIELEKNQVEQQKLTVDIEHKTKQLTTHALNMMQKNKLLQEVNTSIADIVKNPDNLDDSFRKLKRQINRSIKADDDWEVFKMYFEQINSSFFEKLREINPELTTYDLRLCALIKLNLNIKETAAVLNLSPNSIKSARYKLRKRLGLKTKDDLSDIIQGIE